jgi:transposase
MQQVIDGIIRLAYCWVHVRRDFLAVAKDWPGQEAWGESWVKAIGNLFHLNRLRLKGPVSERTQHDEALRKAVEEMKESRDKELADKKLHPAARKALKSLVNHWEGLTRFVDDSKIRMDNNPAEQALRKPVVARKNFYASCSDWSGDLTVYLFSLFATLNLCNVNPRKWLLGYLQACAENGGQPPPDAGQWLPWNLAPKQRQAWAANPPVEDTS